MTERIDAFNIEETISRLRKQHRDDAFCEVKECAAGLSKDIWESVSAFANTGGGLILLGVSERDGFAPVKGFSVERTRDQFMTGIGDGGAKGRLTNAPRYQIFRETLDGDPILAIYITELDSSHKPCYITDRGIQSGSYKRVDDADVPLSANEVYSLLNAMVNSESDRMAVKGASVADLDRDDCERAFAKSKALTPRALEGAKTYEEKLKRLNFTNSDGEITKAGLLSSGVYPQQFFPKLHVDVAVHPGTAKSTGDAVRFTDRALCEGTIGQMIDDSLTAVSRNLKRSSVVDGRGRKDVLEIPEEVLREAVANALIHREYDARFDGESVAVDVYDDRVEVTNPGGLWGGKSKADLADGRSCCRNATLMRLTTIMDLPEQAGSPAEGNGSGIPMMIEKMRAQGLEDPVFCPSIDHFKVVLKRQFNNSSAATYAKIGENYILGFLEEHGELSVRELEKMSGLSVNQVRNRLKKMIGQGAVEATGPATSHNRKYRAKKTRNSKE